MSGVHSPEPQRRFGAKQWVSLGLVILALVFILQNLQIVRVEFFLVHSTAPLWLILSVTLVIGYLIGRFSQRRN